MAVSKENPCISCIHFVVCENKDTYRTAIKNIKDANINLGGNRYGKIKDISWMYMSLNCIHFREKKSDTSEFEESKYSGFMGLG